MLVLLHIFRFEALSPPQSFPNIAPLYPNFASWGKEFGREEEVRRRPARAVLSLLACKGPGPLQSLVAQSNVDGLVAHCSLLGLCTWRWPTKSSSYEIRMNLPISGDWKTETHIKLNCRRDICLATHSKVRKLSSWKDHQLEWLELANAVYLTGLCLAKRMTTKWWANEQEGRRWAPTNSELVDMLGISGIYIYINGQKLSKS